MPGIFLAPTFPDYTYLRNTLARTHAKESEMSTKLTAKQKEKLFKERQNRNFQASSLLDGLHIELVTLSPEQVSQRLADLRRHYER
jgi:regulator of extracellular matrix RemA (YlzA/DUF370 family)